MTVLPEDYTNSVHSQRQDSRPGDYKPLAPPIVPATTFEQIRPGQPRGYDYSRAGNPTRDQLEQALAALENTSHALTFASGLAAVQAIIQLCDPHDTVLVCDDVYGGTYRLFDKIWSRYHVTFHFLDMGHLQDLEHAIQTHKPRLLWLETPSNPLLKIIDLQAVGALCEQHQLLWVVDNTFASPIFQKPAQYGASMILHSTTKYIGGHSDVIGGAIMTSDHTLFEKLRFIQYAAGSVPSPFDAYLLLRSLHTLALRMEKHAHNAYLIAQFLHHHPHVSSTIYPGLPHHPQHTIAKQQMHGFSGIISFYLKGTLTHVEAFTKHLKIFYLAESLGSTKSLINHPATMTHASLEEPLQKKLNITPSLIRLSVGIEDANALIHDLDQALNAAFS